MTPQAHGEAIRTRIITALRGFNARGVTPTQFQIANVIGVSQTAVSVHIRKLRDAGGLDGLSAPGLTAARATTSNLTQAAGVPPRRTGQA